MADPNQDVCPDYMSPEYAEDCLIFTIERKTDAEAAAVLRNLWRVNNTKAIATWE